MKIQRFSHPDDVKNDYWEQLYLLQKQCWGERPFWEFKKCSECHRVYSVEDVLWEGEKIVEGKDFSCISCDGETYDMYDRNFIDEMKKYFKDNVYLILSISWSDEVIGFWIVTKKSISEVVSYDFSSRPNSYDTNKLSQEIAFLAFGNREKVYNDIILLNHIYVIPELRWTTLFFQMFRTMLESFQEDIDLPSILETRFDSRVYPYLRALGFRDIFEDQYGYIPQIIRNNKVLLQQLISAEKWEKIPYLKESLRYAKKVIQENPQFTGVKIYSE